MYPPQVLSSTTLLAQGTFECKPVLSTETVTEIFAASMVQGPDGPLNEITFENPDVPLGLVTFAFKEGDPRAIGFDGSRVPNAYTTSDGHFDRVQ